MPKVIKKNDTATSPTNKKYLFESVFAQTEFSTHYVYQLIFSTIITVFGLINNNDVVVIGAMLISPLFWPVMGMALGIITTRQNILKNSLFSFFVSIASVLIVSFFIALFFPLPELPQAILSRVNPNIIDLFTALAISTIGVLGLYYPTISSTAIGVAISISLLPPLSIAGIGLAKGMYSIVWRSLLMFGTNIVAIIFMGVVVLYLLKVRPRKQEEEKIFRFGVLVSGILMVLMSIPLSFYLKESVRQSSITTQVRNIMSTEVSKIDSTAKVETLNIDFLSVKKSAPLSVSATVHLPEGIVIAQSQRENLLEKLSAETGRDINLNFDVISTVSIQTDEDKQRGILKKNIREIVYDSFVGYADSIEVSNVFITFINSQEVDILIQVKQYGDIPIDYEHLENLKSKLNTDLNINTELEIELIPINKLSESSLKSSTYRNLLDGITYYLTELNQFAEVSNVSVKGDLVTADVMLPVSAVIDVETNESLNAFIKGVLGENSTLQLRIQRFELN